MSKFCPMCNQVTNCTDNCKECLAELEKERMNTEDTLYADLLMEQQEQM